MHFKYDEVEVCLYKMHRFQRCAQGANNGVLYSIELHRFSREYRNQPI